MKYREFFIFIAGMTPQIITETLYALHFKKPPVHPDELFILTTYAGKEKIENELLKNGRLKTFYKEFGIKPALPEIFVVADSKGNPLKDIRTEKDNENLGDFIVNFIRGKTTDKGARLHCSIAGGRKTMSFYLGSALSLLGRSWDKLYHVLVTPEFESHPDFYWKPQKDRILEVKGHDGKTIKKLNTRDAEISLAELPFIRLKDKFDLSGKGFKELVCEGQREIDTASAQMPLKVNLKERILKIGATTIEMVPVQLTVYNAFLREKIKRCKYPEKPYCLDCTDCFPFLIDLSNKRSINEMAADYKKAYGQNTGPVEEFLRQWPEGIEIAALRQNISKINKNIKEHLNDETLSSYYTVTAIGKHGNKRHGVKVEKGKVRVV